jgi:hypothetical protein
MKVWRSALMIVGSVLLGAFLIWALFVDRTYRSLGDPPAGLVVLMVVALGSLACAAIMWRIEARRNVRDWFKNFTE